MQRKHGRGNSPGDNGHGANHGHDGVSIRQSAGTRDGVKLPTEGRKQTQPKTGQEDGVKMNRQHGKLASASVQTNRQHGQLADYVINYVINYCFHVRLSVHSYLALESVERLRIVNRRSLHAAPGIVMLRRRKDECGCAHAVMK